MKKNTDRPATVCNITRKVCSVSVGLNDKTFYYQKQIEKAPDVLRILTSIEIFFILRSKCFQRNPQCCSVSDA